MMGNEEVLPVTDWRQDALDRTLAHITRHDKNAPTDTAGRVPVDYIMAKLRNRRDQLRQMGRQEMLATGALNHRFRFFGPASDDLACCTHISAAQGHTKKVNLDIAMTELLEHQVPAVIMHLTNYWCLNSILKEGLLRGGGDKKNDRPINCHPVGHQNPNLNPGSRNRAQVAVYLDADMIREEVSKGTIKVYATASEHLAFPENIPSKFISHATDTYNHVMVFSKGVGMTAKRKALQQMGPEPPTSSRTSGDPHHPVRGNLPPGGAADRLKYTNVADEPVVGVNCPRCQAHYFVGTLFCLDSRCCYPLTQEAYDTLQSTIKIEPGKQNDFLESIGVQLHKSPYKRSKKLARQDVMKRIRNAQKNGFEGHANRYDRSYTYQQQAVDAGVPRELVVEDADPKTGQKTGQPYYPEKDYLDKNSWEASKVYGLLLLLRGTNRAAAAGSPHSSSSLAQ